MTAFRCLIGFHDFRLPPHRNHHGYGLWTDFRVECQRGCGARALLTCVYRDHWAEKHPEPPEEPA